MVDDKRSSELEKIIDCLDGGSFHIGNDRREPANNQLSGRGLCRRLNSVLLDDNNSATDLSWSGSELKEEACQAEGGILNKNRSGTARRGRERRTGSNFSGSDSHQGTMLPAASGSANTCRAPTQKINQMPTEKGRKRLVSILEVHGPQLTLKELMDYYEIHQKCALDDQEVRYIFGLDENEKYDLIELLEARLHGYARVSVSSGEVVLSLDEDDEFQDLDGFDSFDINDAAADRLSDRIEARASNFFAASSQEKFDTYAPIQVKTNILSILFSGVTESRELKIILEDIRWVDAGKGNRRFLIESSVRGVTTSEDTLKRLERSLRQHFLKSGVRDDVDSVYLPAYGEHCLVLASTKNTCYRAEVLKFIPPSLCTVRLIDYQQKCTVEVKALREMPVEFATTPAFGSYIFSPLFSVTAGMEDDFEEVFNFVRLQLKKASIIRAKVQPDQSGKRLLAVELLTDDLRLPQIFEDSIKYMEF